MVIFSEHHISKLRLFLDLNETLIHTGKVEADVLAAELQELNQFVLLCESLSSQLDKFELVFMTGNSFEYSRRIEEPLGIKNIDGISLIIVSENGLLARSFSEGDLWREVPTEKYFRVVDDFVDKLNKSLSGRFYTQGNEIRLTLKPVRNTFSTEEISEILRVSEQVNLSDACIVYTHKFYVDIDPKEVALGNSTLLFEGKYYATKKLIDRTEGFFNIAVGDSQSDIPMFKAVLESGGFPYWVANTNAPESFQNATLLPHSFTMGVNYLLNSLIT